MQTDNNRMHAGSAKNESASQSSGFLKTDGGKTKSNALEVPSIALPKGGGAIKGIDEKFSVNAVNGTASFSIPLPFAPARGASPALSLSYNSGGGNGIFGLGWNLSLPSIKRKTDKGLPKYFDNIDSDVFLFSEAEDLVPEFKKQRINDKWEFIFTNGHYEFNEKPSPDGLHMIRFYKPRTEGLFARIERWTEIATGEIKWRVITKDNTTTLFGWTKQSRVFDPADPEGKTRIYEWLPEFVFDDKGNCAHYIYEEENTNSIHADSLHDKNRIKNGKLTFTNRYLKKILYGNVNPYQRFDTAFPAADKYLFETVFDYGLPGATPDIINAADLRTDAFSDYKAGFETRTTRLCKRVLLFHIFEELALNTDKLDKRTLVKSLNFTYDTTTQADFTFLKTITAFGYIKKSDGAYSHKNLPPTEFTYQLHEWNKDVKTISTENLVHAPVGFDEGQYQFTDLFNEGLSGILAEQAGGWYYKHNLGNGEFEHAKLVSPKPSFAGLGNQLQLADLDANGGKQLVNYSAEPKGFFELNDEEEWQPFKNFLSLPNINLSDPNARMLDLNGDGKAEILISEDNAFTWYESEGKNGFATSYRTEKPFDEEAGPAIVFADSTQSIFLADMSGDGLSDIVRIRNGEVCYWPNMGYGKFGTKVGMDNAPLFDLPGSFNPSYIRLADIDGSGTTDIIYLGKNKFTCWSNFSGNSFNKVPFEMDAFPDIHNQAKITVTDLLGNGVACIVWNSVLAKDAHAPLRYIDLMNSKKPHIMIGYKNNMGKEVSMEYLPSTHFYLADKKAGKPWITKLHFPVHCISNTKTEDKISGYVFVSRYSYHHGYYDHSEREFRGFGMVEQIDTEDFEKWKKVEATNKLDDEKLNQPPVVSKSWVHTGAFLGEEKILNQFEKEYWFEEMKRQGFTVTHHEHQLPDAKMIDQNSKDITGEMDAQDWQEALRACKGMALRSEVFSKEPDNENLSIEDQRKKLQKELTPYSVATHNCIIQRLQPRGNNKHAIFIVKESEAITYSYERFLSPSLGEPVSIPREGWGEVDPRVAHNLNIKFDDMGNVLEAAAVVYPRKKVNTSLPKPTKDPQKITYISYDENKFTNDINEDEAYRLRLPAEVKTWQLQIHKKPDEYFSLTDFDNVIATAEIALYHDIEKEPKIISTPPAPEVYSKVKRLIEHVRIIYRNNNLEDQLPFGKIASLGFPYESYQLAYTPALLEYIFGTKVNSAVMQDGKFIHYKDENGMEDEDWWIQSGQMNFIDTGETAANAQARFYLPISYTDPYGSITKVEYETHKLFVQKTIDALQNESTVTKFNYRTLSPQQMMDMNENLSEAITDELGLVKAMAVMGKDDDDDNIGEEADDLSLLTEETIDQAAIDDFFIIANAASVCDSATLHAKAKSLLKHATARFVYDFDAYKNHKKPAVVASIVRETHHRKNKTTLNPESKLQLSFEYSNGLSKVIMKKVQAEPGEAKEAILNNDKSVNIVLHDTDKLNPKQLRWIGNGRSILNNKGNPVKQYEPFFSVSPKFEDEKELVEKGVTPIMYYDAMSRLIKTEMPDGTFSKVEFDSWQQTVFDANDNVIGSQWYDKRKDLPPNDPERKAADKAAEHNNTPQQLHFDTLGRPVLQIEHNRIARTDEFYKTKLELDIEGNLRTVTDARENIVMQYKYDMLGNKVYQKSMDAGQRWLMLNIAGNPLRTWDERDHEFQYEYDKLHRPTKSIVINNVGKHGDKLLNNNIFDRIIYGENQPDAKQKNLRGKPVKHYDTGGLIETDEYDFKGQPISSKRKLFKNYKDVVDWSDTNIANAALLEQDNFIFITETDALGRITKQIAPDNSIIMPSYNEAGLLDGETVLQPVSLIPLQYPAVADKYIINIDYNEKGQRNFIQYGNGVKTKYTYDAKTFRLINLTSNTSSNQLQNLSYTYDPVGNITQIEDKALNTEFFDNQIIEPISTYTYDAAYRLIEATGRENGSALNFATIDNWNDGTKMIPQHNPGNGMVVIAYTERYKYNAVGNIKEMNHQGSWTRINEYETNNNRLLSSTVGGHTFLYPHHNEHGYITKLPHLNEMGWNFKEELVSTSQQKVNPATGSTPETTYYQYDGQGQRIRKITENFAEPNNDPTKKDERIYIAGYETYRTYDANGKNFERESLSLMDKEHRFVMIDRVKLKRSGLGSPPVGFPDRGTNEVQEGARYQLHNHLGSACLEINEAAKVISYEEYHPYGTTAYQAKSTAIACAAKRYRYTGMERDEETGLEYHSARYYLPWLGRWLSSDPIGIGDGVNDYSYTSNNPICFHDPSGHYLLGEFPTTTTLRGLPIHPVFSIVAIIGMLVINHYSDEADRVQKAKDESFDMGIKINLKVYEELEKRVADGLLTKKEMAKIIRGEQFPTDYPERLLKKEDDFKTKKLQEDYTKRQREAAAHNYIQEGRITQEEADQYIKTGNVLLKNKGTIPGEYNKLSLKGDAGKIHGEDQYRKGQVILTAILKLSSGKLVKVVIPNEGAGWRPGQKELAIKMGYRTLEGTTPGSDIHAEQSLEAQIAPKAGKNATDLSGAQVLRWAISRGVGGTSEVCTGQCQVIVKKWGPQDK
jgi:RHS repeat-associated protein